MFLFVFLGIVFNLCLNRVIIIIVNYKYMGSHSPLLRVYVRPSGSCLAANRIAALTAWQHRTEYRHVCGMYSVSPLVTKENLKPTVAGNVVKSVGQAPIQA
jgi:hypothetical protein